MKLKVYFKELGFPDGSDSKESTCNARAPGSIPGLGRSTGEGNCEVKSLSRVRLFATPWTVAYQASPSMGFSRQEYWSGLPSPSPGDFPKPGIEPRYPSL